MTNKYIIINKSSKSGSEAIYCACRFLAALESSNPPAYPFYYRGMSAQLVVYEKTMKIIIDDKVVAAND